MPGKEHQEKIRVAAVSLGCAKNRVDTEEILGLLGKHGYIITGDYGAADLVIVNTCSFIDAAQQESVETILRVARRPGGRPPLVVAAGCLAQRYGADLLKEIPELSGVIGVHGYGQLVDFLKRCRAGRRESLVPPPGGDYRSLGARLPTTAVHSVYVKIADGCDNRCRYCLIPSLRGPYRSREPSEITGEIEALVGQGAREVNLVAQDTTAYGMDRQGFPDLAGLVERILRAAPSLPWLRILYAYPTRVDDRLVRLMAREKRICSYLDLPLQHVDGDILAGMGRFYTFDEIAGLVRRLRRALPDMALRTTYLVGFPGETPRHFEKLYRFVRTFPFEHVGVFAYSPQEGTAAASLAGQVPARVREFRRRRLMEAQQEVSLRLNRRYAGRRVTLLVDRPVAGRNVTGFYLGRMQQQAPEVDGAVLFRSPVPLTPGQWVSVKIAAAGPYRLLGTGAKLLHKNPL